MIGLSGTDVEVWAMILDDAVIRHVVVVPIESIAQRLGLSPETVEEGIGRLVLAGLIERWPASRRGPSVCLSASSAADLGLVLARVSNAIEALEWSEKSRKGRAEKSRKGPATNESDLDCDLDSMVGPDRRPEDIAISIEEAERTAPKYSRRSSDREADPDRLPCPTILIEGPRAWTAEAASPCPVCTGRTLRPSEMCLRCDRWSLDWMVARIWRARTP